ncbi:hypothetical protein ABPG74_007783 [Tetrahymena malaccensis]
MKIQQLFKKNCLYFIILLFLINQKVYFFTESQEEHEDFCNPTYPQSNYYNEEFINNKEEICQLLNDNGYKLVKEITYGNYTEVYKVNKSGTGEYYALKINYKQNIPYGQKDQKFMKQQKKCVFTNSIQDTFYDKTRNKFFINIVGLYEYNLEDLLWDIIKGAQQLNEVEFLNMIFYLVDGLIYLQSQDIIHSGIYLQNILIDKQKKIPVYQDFSLSKTNEKDKRINFALEADQKNIGKNSDIYSLGGVLLKIIDVVSKYQNISDSFIFLKKYEEVIKVHMISHINTNLLELHKLLFQEIQNQNDQSFLFEYFNNIKEYLEKLYNLEENKNRAKYFYIYDYYFNIYQKIQKLIDLNTTLKNLGSLYIKIQDL